MPSARLLSHVNLTPFLGRNGHVSCLTHLLRDGVDDAAQRKVCCRSALVLAVGHVFVADSHPRYTWAHFYNTKLLLLKGKTINDLAKFTGWVSVSDTRPPACVLGGIFLAVTDPCADRHDSHTPEAGPPPPDVAQKYQI